MRMLPLLFLLAVACDIPEPSDPIVSANPSDDLDGDGATSDVDCNDEDRTVNPDAVERCDGIDQDCDGLIDEDAIDRGVWYTDSDGDGFGDPNAEQRGCTQPEDTVSNPLDCDDENPLRNPATVWNVDADDDGYGSPHEVLIQCSRPEGYVRNSNDCNDEAKWVNPGNPEVCNGRDDDCDGLVDDDDDDVTGNLVEYAIDSDGDGYGDATAATQLRCYPAPGFVSNNDDCNDNQAGAYPGAVETCATAFDDDCDGLVYEENAVGCETYHRDKDEDGFGSETLTRCLCPSDPNKGVYDTQDATDCDDNYDNVYPGAPELCGQPDNDCNPSTNDESVLPENQTLWFMDNDGDGYGLTSQTIRQCERTNDVASLDGDCDDNDYDRNPGLIEFCDGQDNDCDDTTLETGLISTYNTNYDTITEALAGPDYSVYICDSTFEEDVVLGSNRSKSLRGYNNPTIDGTGSGSVISVGPDASLQIYDLTITGGAGATGGGIFNDDSYVAVANVTIEGNSATGNGGGYGETGSYPEFECFGCTIQNNTAGGAGGGFYFTPDGYAYFEDAVVDSNTAVDGGGLYLGKIPSTNTSTCSNNTATGAGGGVYADTTGSLGDWDLSANEGSEGGNLYVTDTLSLDGSVSVTGAVGGYGVWLAGSSVSFGGGNTTGNSPADVYVEALSTGYTAGNGYDRTCDTSSGCPVWP